MKLDTPVIEIKGVGDKTSALLSKLNIHTAKDLLYHFPRGYEKLTEPELISSLQAGEKKAVRGIVVGDFKTRKIRSLTILNFTLQDASGRMSVTFFNMPYLKSQLKKGSFYIFYGLVQKKGTESLMEQPRVYQEEEYRKLRDYIQPLYPLTKGITNHFISKIMKEVLSKIQDVSDPLPKELLEKHGLMDYMDALHAVHFPQKEEHYIEARKRLVFQEFFIFIYMIRQSKVKVEQEPSHYVMMETAEVTRFIEALPFKMTNAQCRVYEEIKEDLCSPYVMNRLVQGDVGSGKTILAFEALLLCVSNGYQGALMAPTEVLAKQHFDTIMADIKKHKLPFKPVLLTGSVTAKEKKLAYEAIEKGEVNLVIGTHAVIQEKVVFKNLALVITDEQHRFGVRQREMLAGKGNQPHILVMSATPIPRSLAIILYGDMNLSVVDELPANRLPIKNCVVNSGYRPKAYTFIEKEVAKGRQAYIICPMVEESETMELESVTRYSEKLREVLPSSIQVACLHGKMKPAEKNRIMEEFAQKHIDVLVSTTVIEVGINVPNATIMMVENAERFGLAQLHQLRGRVGRGKEQSYCIFVSGKDNEETMKRLDILNHSNDGFHIASEDLKMRGPGDLFGIRQSGDLAFRIGDIYQDSEILKLASTEADRLLEEEIELSFEHMDWNSIDFTTI